MLLKNLLKKLASENDNPDDDERVATFSGEA